MSRFSLRLAFLTAACGKAEAVKLQTICKR
jgi:hypothetical protein